MAPSCETCQEGLDLGICSAFAQCHAFLKWYPLSGIPSSPGNIPSVLQGPTSMAPYPCGGALSILSELAATPLCSPTPAHNVFTITRSAIIVW